MVVMLSSLVLVEVSVNAGYHDTFCIAGQQYATCILLEQEHLSKLFIHRAYQVRGTDLLYAIVAMCS